MSATAEERGIGIYQHPNLGELDVFKDIDGVTMYARGGEVGDVPDAWWELLTWVGPRVYPPPKAYHPDLGTMYFVQSMGSGDVFVCDCCGVALHRGALPDDQWPSEACPWCPAGRLARRFLRKEQAIGDDGPDFLESPYADGPDFLEDMNWLEAREHLKAWRQRTAARTGGGTGWVYRPAPQVMRSIPRLRIWPIPSVHTNEFKIVPSDKVEIVAGALEAFGAVASEPMPLRGTVIELSRNGASEVFANVLGPKRRTWVGVPVGYLKRLIDENTASR